MYAFLGLTYFVQYYVCEIFRHWWLIFHCIHIPLKCDEYFNSFQLLAIVKRAALGIFVWVINEHVYTLTLALRMEFLVHNYIFSFNGYCRKVKVSIFSPAGCKTSYFFLFPISPIFSNTRYWQYFSHLVECIDTCLCLICILCILLLATMF